MSSKPVLWSELPWTEIPSALEESRHAVLIPLGATEQHGPHLGTGVDTGIAKAVCHAVSARLKVPVLPPLPYGSSQGHSQRWPGTVSLSPRTLIAVLSELGDWLAASGVRRLFFVSAHVTNFAPARCALEELRARHDDLMVAVISTPEISPRVREAFCADADDWHANAAETSLMLFLHPGMARPEAIRSADDPDRTIGLEFSHPVNRTSRNGVTGSPSRSSSEQGRQLFEWMVDDLSDRVSAGLAESPPLAAAWRPL